MTRHQRRRRQLLRVVENALDLALPEARRWPCHRGTDERRLLMHVMDSKNPKQCLLGTKAEKIEAWIDHVAALAPERVRAVLERSR